jgi:hypothetical protein
MPFSLMNGLSAAGQSIAQFAGQAGLETQKADLARQQMMLADQLATTRETGLETLRQAGAMQLQIGQQAFQGAQTDKEIAARAALQQGQQTFQGAQTDKEIAARAAEAEKQRQANVELEKMRLNAPTDTMKTLAALGYQFPNWPGGSGMPQAGTTAPSTSSTPVPPSSSGTGAATSGTGTSPTDTTGTGTSTPPSGAPGTGGGTGAGGGTGGTGTGAVPPSGGTGAGTGAGGTGAGGTGAGGTGAGTSGTTPGTPSQPPTLTDSPIVRKLLGFPQAGSEEEARSLMAQDVAKDQAFANATPGQRAAEVERRLAVAKGNLLDKPTQEAMARGIASYQLAPPSGFAMSRQGMAEVMGRVMELNPNYQETRYDEVKRTVQAFGGGGKEGGIIRSIDAAVQHTDVLAQAHALLGNGPVQVVNEMRNRFKAAFGVPAPTTFDGLKQIVATEILKAIGGGIGTGEDRDRLMKNLDRASSPEQLNDVLNGFRILLGGQLKALKHQYEADTGFTTGPFRFETKLSDGVWDAVMSPHLAAPAANASDTAPMTGQQMYGGSRSDNTRTPQQMYGGSTQQAAPAPKPPAVGEVQQGYRFTGGDPANPASWARVQ